MTRSNRVLNRLILLLLGLAVLASAGALATPFLAPDAIAWRVDDLAAPLGDPTVLWITAVAAAVLVVLSVMWIVTRGRGRTPAAVETDDVRIDAGAVRDILRHQLSGVTDIVGLDAAAYFVRRERVIEVRVQVRRRADLARVMTETRRAVDEVDRMLGTPLPLLVHLTTGLKSAVTGARTAH